MRWPDLIRLTSGSVVAHRTARDPDRARHHGRRGRGGAAHLDRRRRASLRAVGIHAVRHQHHRHQPRHREDDGRVDRHLRHGAATHDRRQRGAAPRPLRHVGLADRPGQCGGRGTRAQAPRHGLRHGARVRRRFSLRRGTRHLPAARRPAGAAQPRGARRQDGSRAVRREERARGQRAGRQRALSRDRRDGGQRHDDRPRPRRHRVPAGRADARAVQPRQPVRDRRDVRGRRAGRRSAHGHSNACSRRGTAASTSPSRRSRK